jgi:ElaB protein
MESTANDLGREHTRNGEAFRTASTRQAVRDEVRRLMEDVEELIRRVGDAADPEIARLRGKVEAAISTTKEAISSRTDRVQQRARETFAAGDSYVHEQPWRAVGIAAFIGLVVGFLAARR